MEEPPSSSSPPRKKNPRQQQQRRTPASRRSNNNNQRLPSRNNNRSNNNRSNNNTNNRRQNNRSNLCDRCLLIRNLPKGFVARSDLTDRVPQTVRIRSMVYCESSQTSVMVEFASARERGRIYALDPQRKSRIRQRKQQQKEEQQEQEQETEEGDVPEQGHQTTTLPQGAPQPFPFDFGVTVEACASDRFVRKVLGEPLLPTPKPAKEPQPPEPPRDEPPLPHFLAGILGDDADPAESPAQEAPSDGSGNDSSSLLVHRCVVIRKARRHRPNQDSEDDDANDDDDDFEIGEAPPYQRWMEEGSSDAGKAPAALDAPPPMALVSGDLRETVVRGVALRSRPGMMPAMVCELESREAVDRLLQAEKTKQAEGTGSEEESGDAATAMPNTTTKLSVPIEIHRVRSERYARTCFGGTQASTASKPSEQSQGQSRTRTRGRSVSTEEDNEARSDDGGATTSEGEDGDDDDENDPNTTDDEAYHRDDTASSKTNQNGLLHKGTQKLRGLEDTVDSLQSDVSFWKAQAQKAKNDLLRQRQAQHENGVANAAAPASSGGSSQQEALEEKIRLLLAENDRLKTGGSNPGSASAAASSPASAGGSTNTNGGNTASTITADNGILLAQIAENDKLQSELEESKATQKQAEEARNKLEEENSGLLRYVLELEGHRTSRAAAGEERYKELEKKHSDLSTLYRFVQAQAEQSSQELRQAVEERNKVSAELDGFKSAWRQRMEAQRRLEASQQEGQQDQQVSLGTVCSDCETVEFYATLQDALPNAAADSSSSSSSSSNHHHPPEPENGEPNEPTTNGTAAATAGKPADLSLEDSASKILMMDPSSAH